MLGVPLWDVVWCSVGEVAYLKLFCVNLRRTVQRTVINVVQQCDEDLYWGFFLDSLAVFPRSFIGYDF